jgi:chemotaxis protein CheD
MATNEQFGPSKLVLVGRADMMVSQDPGLILSTSALGAGLGIAVYDPVVKAGGLLHSMLPDSRIDAKRAASRPGLFLDTGLALLLDRAAGLKARKEDLLVYVAGGSGIMDETSDFDIGRRNYTAFAGLLASHGLKIHAEEVGGKTDRTMQLDLATGEARLKHSGSAKMKILCKS